MYMYNIVNFMHLFEALWKSTKLDSVSERRPKRYAAMIKWRCSNSYHVKIDWYGENVTTNLGVELTWKNWFYDFRGPPPAFTVTTY